MGEGECRTWIGDIKEMIQHPQHNSSSPSLQTAGACENYGGATAVQTEFAWLSPDSKRGGWDPGIQAHASLG